MRKLYTLLLCFAVLQTYAQNPLVFKDFDLNPNANGNTFSKPYGFTSLPNGKFIFMAFKDTAGYELWASDGTKAGTKFIKDVYAGSNYSNIFYPTEFAGKVYFSASSKGYGRELWMTDGTDTGTQLVKDINLHTIGDGPEQLTVYKGKLYFTMDNWTHGKELWVTDGTSTGTTMLVDINLGKNSSWPRGFTEYQGKLYFSADDGTNGRELWVTDGTSTGTTMLKDILPGNGNSDPGAFFVSTTNELFFRATTPATGYELWKTDGTTNGSQMIKDISGDSTDGIKFQGSEYAMVNYNSKVYFRGSDTTHGTELWVTDGTSSGTKLLKDINTVASLNRSSAPWGFTLFKNKIYFSATDTSSNIELWVSDGTSAGTNLFKELRSGRVYGGAARLFMVYKNHLYMKAQLDTGGWQLIRCDGTASGITVVRAPTATVKDNCVEWPSTQLYLNPVDSFIYMGAEYTNSGYELWAFKDTTGSPTPGGILQQDKGSTAIYPNPNNGTFTLAIDNIVFKQASLQVYDIMGRICHEAPVKASNTTISIDQPAGVYMIKLQLDDKVITKRILLE